MKKLIIPIGNIASGKTTLINDLVKLNYYSISRDALRYMLGSGIYIYDIMFEKIIRDTSISMLRKLVMTNVNIVMDETNVSKSSRETLITIAKKRKYRVIAYVLPKISKKESVKRRLSDPHGDFSKEIWEGVWEKFNSMYEEPTYEEGFDEIAYKVSK